MLEMTTEGARGAVTGGAKSEGEAAPEEKGALSSDFETFLKMLTAQLRNQDPLNPMESTDFAIQLATFSGVEQQVLTNELLTQMVGAGGGGAGAHATWIGLDALSPAPAAFDGAPLPLEFAPPEGAATATLVATNALGIEVGRYPVDPAQGQITWAGTDGSGAPLPEGRYAFELRAVGSDGVEVASPVLSYARVAEIRPGSEGTRVVLQGGGEVAADEVVALRAPAG